MKYEPLLNLTEDQINYIKSAWTKKVQTSTGEEWFLNECWVRIKDGNAEFFTKDELPDYVQKIKEI